MQTSMHTHTILTNIELQTYRHIYAHTYLHTDTYMHTYMCVQVWQYLAAVSIIWQPYDTRTDTRRNTTQ